MGRTQTQSVHVHVHVNDHDNAHDNDHVNDNDHAHDHDCSQSRAEEPSLCSQEHRFRKPGTSVTRSMPPGPRRARTTRLSVRWRP